MAIVVLLSVGCKNSDSVYTSKKYLNIGERMEQEFLLTHDPALNSVPTHRLLSAVAIKEQKLNEDMSMFAPVPAVSWVERGPSNIGGRTRALIFDLNDAANDYKKVWAGGVSGGLWYTNDITAAVPVWNKIDDFMDNLAISAIVQDPNDFNTMYIGTGEGWFNADAVQGAGMWKTTDGGITWNHLPSTANFYFVQDLAIDLNGHLYATTRPAGSVGASGLMKSVNGGNTWENVLNTPTASSNRGADIEVAANGDIYVSMGTTGSNGGIYRSIFEIHEANTGNTGTWVNITPNTSGTISAPNSFWNRIELATAPSNANVVYALFQGYSNSNVTSIQQYNASSNTWTVRTVPTIIDQGSNSVFTRGQAFYDLIAAVDPNNSNVLYIGGVDALRSTNQGTTWVQMTTWSLYNATGFTPNQYVHADHHALVYAPGSSSRMLLGTDGGVFYTTNANEGSGKPGFIERNNGYNVTQYYSGYLHPTETNKMIGGTQDNGSHMFTTAGMNAVTEITGGDGGFSFIDEDNPNQMITTYTYNNFFISTNGGTSFSQRFLNSRGSFINPMDYDHLNNNIYSSDNPGRYFRWKNVFAAPPYDTTSVSVTAFSGQRVTHAKVSPVSNRVFFGLANGSVVMVDDANLGTSKTGVIIKPASPGVVSSIAIDPRDENHMLVSYSNYGVVSVYESFNATSGSPIWQSVEGDLPDMPVRWAMFDPRNSDWAILATELGVWSTDNLNGPSTEWSPTNSGLANVRVDMLRFRPADNTILAATHGRGMFTAVIPGSTTPDINFATSTLPVNETGTVTGTDCRIYSEYEFYIGIENAPTGDAIVKINTGSGNAVEGLDFDFTTNGNFESPSDEIIFADGAIASYPITIRVYDDSEVEPEESIIFNYTLSGSSNAQSGLGSQQFLLKITDNDREPQELASVNGTIGTSPFYALVTSGDAQVLNSALAGKRTHLMYTAAELTAMGLGEGEIQNIGFYFNKKSTRNFGQISIKLGSTTNSSLIPGSSFVPGSTVLSGNYTNRAIINGWNDFELNTPFYWNGVDNLIIEICFTNASADPSETPDEITGFNDGSGLARMVWQNVNCATNYSSVTYFEGFKPIINIKMELEGNAVATSTVLKQEYFNNTHSLNVYNTSGEIMASIRNLSAHNFGCLEVEIDRAGTGVKPFWNNNSENRVLDKTFYFNPESNLPVGSYEITLYYTDEEIAGWEAETGNSFNDILLIKTKGRAGDITPSNPGNPADVEIVIPTRGNFGTGKTLSYTFNTGFSGFAAGIVGQALPVKWNSFEAKYNSPNIDLHWSTSYELNNSGFDIEKSEDGKNFRKIGFVPSAGDHNELKNYRFTDYNVFAVNNFYRLKQTDLDGRFNYSNILNVKTQETRLMYKILQNPVVGDIQLQFNAVPGTAVDAVLIDNAGKRIAEWKVTQLNTLYLKLPLTSVKPTPGMYVLQIRFNGELYSEKLIFR